MFSWFTHVLIIDRPCLKLSWSPLRSLWHRSDPLLPSHSDSDLEASGRRLRRRSDTIYQLCWMRDWHHRHEKRIVWIGEHTLLLKFRVRLSQTSPSSQWQLVMWLDISCTCGIHGWLTIVFLCCDRKLSGAFLLMSKLNVTLDTRAIWEKVAGNYQLGED